MVQHLLTVFPVFSAEWKQQLPLNLPQKQGVAVKLQSTSRCPQTAMISLGYQLVSVMNVVFTQYTIDINRPSPNSPKMSGVYTFVGFAIFDSHVLPLEKTSCEEWRIRRTKGNGPFTRWIFTHFHTISLK